MTREQEVFLSIIADFIFGRDSRISEELDWNEIENYAKLHQVQGIVFHQVKNCPALAKDQSGVAARLQSAYYQTYFHYYQQSSYASEVKEAFREEQIRHFVIKGEQVAAAYPCPELRTMGDMDLVLPSADREKAHGVMLRLGYSRNAQDDMEWAYFKDGYEVELHDKLLYDTELNGAQSVAGLDDFWHYVQQQGEELYLDWSYHLAFLIVHLRKHLLYSSVGFRQFLDLLFVVRQHGDDIDWGWLSKKLEQLGMLDFSRQISGFCLRWFGTGLPLGEIMPEDEFYALATEKIFAGGVFGYDDPDNQHNAFISSADKKHRWPLFTVLGNFFRRIFPPYKELARAQRYSWVAGRPYLLPLVWCYRLIYEVLHFQRGSAQKAIVSRDEVKERTWLLKQWRV